MTALERHGEMRLDDETRRRLLRLSPATADRLLRRERARLRSHGRAVTKPGTLLSQSIAVLNPAALLRQMQACLEALWALANQPAGSSELREVS